MEAGLVALMVVLITNMTLGILIGMFVQKRAEMRKPSLGIIHADYSDPEDGPYLFLELKVPVEQIVSRKRVTLDVDVTEYISQK